jgi:hypothetical protein
MDLGAFRTPDGQMQGAATMAISLHIVEEPQRSRWPSAAETLRAAAGCVAALRCFGLNVSQRTRLRPRALIRSHRAAARLSPLLGQAPSPALPISSFRARVLPAGQHSLIHTANSDGHNHLRAFTLFGNYDILTHGCVMGCRNQRKSRCDGVLRGYAFPILEP